MFNCNILLPTIDTKQVECAMDPMIGGDQGACLPLHRFPNGLQVTMDALQL